MRERWQDPEQRAKMTATLSERARCQQQDPEYRAKQRDGVLRRWQDPAQRAQHAEKSRQLWQDPAYRAKMLAARAKRKQDKGS